MENDTKKQHFVPRTYLRMWETYDSSTDANNLQVKYKSDGKLARYNCDNSLFIKRKYYTLNMDYIEYSNTILESHKNFAEIIQDVFKEKNIYAEYEKRRIENCEDILTNIKKINEWTFRRINDDSIYKKNKILNVLKERNDTTIENELGKFIENKFVEKIKKILNSINLKVYSHESGMRYLNENNIEYLINNLVIMMYRNPYCDANKIINNWIASVNDILNERLEVIQKYLMNNALYNCIHDCNKNYISLTKQKLKDKQIYIYKTDKYYFWTSDIPVGMHDGVLFFPLTPYFLLAIGADEKINNNEIELIKLNQKDVKKWNEIIEKNCEKVIISANEKEFCNEIKTKTNDLLL